VADDRSNIPSPFDVKTIKYLVGLMSQHDLSEVDLREGDLRIRLRRGPKGITVQPMMAPVPTATPPPVPASSPLAPAAASSSRFSPSSR